MFKVKAKFIGVNPLGFTKNEIYEIVLISLLKIHIYQSSPFCVSPQKDFGWILRITTEKFLICEYESWEEFISNWEILNYQIMTFPPRKVQPKIDNDVNNGLKSSIRNYKINDLLS